MEVPIYSISLDDAEMVGLALVDAPAIDSNFQCFSRNEYEFSIISDERRMVLGPLIRVDYPILRLSPSGEPYYLRFSREVAEVLLRRFLTDGNQCNVNLQHSSYFPKGIEPVQFFIKDSSKGISPVGFDSIADGSVFCQYHISDDAIWSACKDGSFRGFSLEGYLTPQRFSSEVDFRSEVLKSLFDVIKSE